MLENIAESLVRLGRAFAKEYSGTANIQEPVPIKPESLQMDAGHLEKIHRFASDNPIYYNSYEQSIGSVPCIVYEGDINRFWLGSIAHGASRAPFSPTWMLSAYVLSLVARDLGAQELVDVGSGDGRIAYCAAILGLGAHGIEIDGALAGLQGQIAESTGVSFDPACTDAAKFDYTSLGLSRPAFFIGGLAHMGGDVLARGLVEKISHNRSLRDAATVAFTGTVSGKYPADRYGLAGWGQTIRDAGMRTVRRLSLPTVWTFREPDETPYIFASFAHS